MWSHVQWISPQGIHSHVNSYVSGQYFLFSVPTLDFNSYPSTGSSEILRAWRHCNANGNNNLNKWGRIHRLLRENTQVIPDIEMLDGYSNWSAGLSNSSDTNSGDDAESTVVVMEPVGRKNSSSLVSRWNMSTQQAKSDAQNWDPRTITNKIGKQ